MIFTFIFTFSVQGAWPASSDLENEQIAEVTMSRCPRPPPSSPRPRQPHRPTHLPEFVPLAERQEEPCCSVAIQNNTGQFEQD